MLSSRRWSPPGHREGAAYGAANYQYNYLNDKQRQNGIAAYRAALECKTSDNCTAENARLAFYLAMSQANTATLISVCTSDPSSSDCRSMINDLQSFVNAYNNLNIPTAVDIANGTADGSTAATQALAGMDGFIPYDVILALHLAEVANGKSADVAIQEALLDISQRNGGIKTFLDAMGIAAIAPCAASLGALCAIGVINAAVSANHLAADVPQALTGQKAQTAAVLALTGMGVDEQDAEKWQSYVEAGVLVVSVVYVGGEMVYQLRVNKAALAAGDEELAAFNNKSFDPKTNQTVDGSNTGAGGFKPFKSTETRYDANIKTYDGSDVIELDISGNPKPFQSAEISGRYSNGNLQIDFYKTDVKGQNIGTELVSNAIEAAGPSNVRTVSGQFGLDSKSVYDSLLSSLMSPTDAAWGTPLGKTMKQLGFTSVEVTPGNLPSFKFGFE